MLLLLSGLLGCLICTAACLGIGALLLRVLLDAKTTERLQVGPVAMVASAFLLGEGILAGLWVVCAAVGWFTGPIVIGSLLLAGALGGWSTWKLLQPAMRRAREWLIAIWADSWSWRVILLATLLLVLFYGFATLTVALPSHGDGAAYYLPYAKWLMLKGQVRAFSSYESFSQMPLLGEVHFAAMLFFGVEQEARLIVTPTVLAGAALLLALGARCGLGKRGQWIVLAIAWTSTTFNERLTDGKTDLFGFAMGIAAYYWVAVHRGRDTSRALRLAGLFVGFATMAKLSLLTCVLPGVVLFATWTAACESGQESLAQRGKAVFRAWFDLAFWALLLAMPHFIKNAVLCGEPFAPLFTFAAAKTWLYQTSFHSKQTGQAVLAKYPLLLVYGRVYGQGGTISILLLIFAPLLIVLPKSHPWRRSVLLKVSLMALLGIASYLVCSHITSNAQVAPRYLLPTLMLLALPMARAAEHVTEREGRPRGLTVAIWCSLLVALFYAHRASGLRCWASGLKTYITEGANRGEDSSIEALLIVNQRARLGDRLFMAGASRIFLRNDLIQCTNGWKDTPSGATPQERWASLHDHDFSWVFVDRRFQPELLGLLMSEEGKHAVPDWLDVEKVYSGENCHLWRLQPRAGAPPPGTTTREVRPGVWEVERAQELP